jgi:membrane-bound acyltransferase YfiQ involved in biofilm formation
VTAMDERRRILFYESAGIVFIIVFGSILHFTFEWSGSQAIVGVFSAVNESVWEHLKLGFWPAIVFALIEFKYLKKAPNNFVFAKTVGIYLIPVIIMVLFYSYTAILGESILVIDILTFVIAVIVGQLVSYRLLTGKTLPYNLDRVSLIALLLLGLAFVLFTFYPPQLPMFQDPITGEYGIVSH